MIRLKIKKTHLKKICYYCYINQTAWAKFWVGLGVGRKNMTIQLALALHIWPALSHFLNSL